MRLVIQRWFKVSRGAWHMEIVLTGWLRLSENNCRFWIPALLKRCCCNFVTSFSTFYAYYSCRPKARFWAFQLSALACNYSSVTRGRVLSKEIKEIFIKHVSRTPVLMLRVFHFNLLVVLLRDNFKKRVKVKIII